MRLGDLDELERKIDELSINAGFYMPIYEGLLNAVKRQLTIDAVPVVRCVECKHRDPENHHCDHPAGTTIYFPRKDDDFCSYGEKRCEDAT